MLRFLTTAGLVLALSQTALAQAPPVPPTSGTTPGHNMMMSKHHAMMSKPSTKNKMNKKTSMMHGNQMHGTTPNGAGPSHSP